MRRLIVLFISFIGILSLSTPLKAEMVELHDINSNQKNYQIGEETMIKPNDLAPSYEIQNLNSDNIFISDYFAPYCFSKLNGHFGNNRKGSCTYVAVDMLLSYYDTFWADNFLPENYDGKNAFADVSILDAVESPGSKNETDIDVNLYNLSDEEYFRLVNNNSSKIVHFDLVSRGIEKLDLYNETTKDLTLGTFLRDVRDVIYDYLEESTILNRSVIKIGFQNSNASIMRKTIIDKVTHGIPVIVDAASATTAHSFIAYDYDETNDEIYCNAGWYRESTHHISMTDLGYTRLQEIMYFEPNIEHSHSYNYSINNEYGNLTQICSCSSMIPTQIEISSNFLDVNPTFKWNSLIKEKWSKEDNLYHSFSILKSNRYEAFQIDNIFDNKYTLTSQDWASVINDVADPSYYVYITIGSKTYPYWDDFYCSVLFKEPNRYLYKSSFLPKDWGIAGRYYFQNELDLSSVSSNPDRMYATATQNGLTIESERLRCGYIENLYIVLSPRRESAGRSYFEMNFDKPVYSFMYRACMWSASENLDGIAIIQTKDSSGNWTTLKDIPISTLKTKENGLTQFSEMTLYGIYGLRFETTATATGDRNKGRLCLGDIVFSTSLITGISTYLDYDYII